MTNWRQSEPKIWHWRIRAKASDNQIVTLGRYDTRDAAQLDCDKIVKGGLYRNVRIEEIKPATQQ